MNRCLCHSNQSFTLYSSVWATLLMFLMFIFSGLAGSNTGYRPPITLPNADSNRNVWVSPQALAGRIIALDPGHGGQDPGTVGVGKTTEAENVLAIAWELKTMLEKAGAQVIMTRQTDISPAQGTSYSKQTNGQLAVRVAKANRSGAHIFVSIHNDWNDNRSLSGTTTYYYQAQDWVLAEALQKGVVQQLGTSNVGVKRGNIYILRNTSMPAALVEVGFLSHQGEADLLSQQWYRLEAARGMFNGILNYFMQLE